MNANNMTESTGTGYDKRLGLNWTKYERNRADCGLEMHGLVSMVKQASAVCLVTVMNSHIAFFPKVQSRVNLVKTQSL